MNITQKSNRHFGVALKLVVFIILTGFIFVGIQTGLNFMDARNKSKAKAELELFELYSDYSYEVSRVEKASAALSSSFAERSDILELFLAKDREGLLELLTPIFKTLAADYDIVHLYVHEPNGTVFVRIHNPLKFGDDITYRRTAAAVLRSQVTVTGVEIGPSRLGVRSVSPLFNQGKFVGMVEVGLDYDQLFIEQLKVTHGADYSMWVTAEAAAPANLGPTDTALESPLPETMFYYAGTRSTRLPVPAEVYRRVLESGQPEVQFVSDDNEELAVLVAPLLAYGDRTIGILEISRSRTKELAALQSSQMNLLIVAVGLSALSLALIWGSINFVVLRPLRHLTSVASYQLEGNLAARVKLLPNDEFGQLGRTFNTLSEQLDQTVKSQERVIIERTTQLQIALNIARTLSSILDFEQLLKEIVDLIHNSFDLYQTHIYLLDEDGEYLVVAEGYGQVGADLKARGYRVPVSALQNSISRAAYFGEVVRIDDVRLEEGWASSPMMPPFYGVSYWAYGAEKEAETPPPHTSALSAAPLLPETRSEMVVPIKLGEQVMGVLDMQSDREAGFSQQDEDTILAVAGEVAVAIRNARRFTETNQALAEAKKIQQLYTQSGWQAYKFRQKITAYQQVKPEAVPVEDKLLAQIKQGVTQGQTVVMTPARQNGEGDEQIQSALAVPLTIRGQVIGHIRVHDTEQSRQWSAEEITLLESISEQMTLAIENARLFGDTQQRASREKLAREIADKMRTSPDVDAIIQTGLTELAKALGVSRTYVKLTSKLE